MLINDYLLNLKKQKTFPNSLIIKTNFCCNFKTITKAYLKTLCCDVALPFCDECQICNRINQDAYLDLIYFDNHINEISKEDIITVQSTFSKPSSENTGIKLYVIQNIEKTNKHVLNSLLKFIEEPPKNTYLLMFTKNQNQIIPTILSRSAIININDHSEEMKCENKEIKELAEYIFDDLSYFNHFTQQYDLENINNFAKSLLKSKSMLEIAKDTNKIKDLEKEELYIFIKILIHYANPNVKMQLLEILPKLQLNLNKRILSFKIIDIMSKQWKQ
ncbi:MAG: hypothetical protein ACRC4L_00640 [Mycoplasma sp.]